MANTSAFDQALPDFASSIFSKKRNNYAYPVPSQITPEEQAGLEEMGPLQASFPISSGDIDEQEVAYEAGRAEGSGEARAALEAELTCLREEYECQLEALRSKLSLEQAQLLGEMAADAIKRFEERLSLQIAPIFEVLLAEKMRNEAVEDFAQRFAKLATEGETLEISGPPDLIARFRSRSECLPNDCRFKETTAGELSFSYGDHVLATRLAPLLDELKMALR